MIKLNICLQEEARAFPPTQLFAAVVFAPGAVCKSHWIKWQI